MSHHWLKHCVLCFPTCFSWFSIVLNLQFLTRQSLIVIFQKTVFCIIHCCPHFWLNLILKILNKKTFFSSSSRDFVISIRFLSRSINFSSIFMPENCSIMLSKSSFQNSKMFSEISNNKICTWNMLQVYNFVYI